jgi:dihydrofolate reductase
MPLVGAGTGKVVVNRAMSLDGFIAGPGDDVSWIGDLAPSDVAAEVAAATGAMLVGRRTWDVGERIKAEEPGSTDYPFSGPMFVLTHRPLDRSVPGVTVLSGDILEAVATALRAAGDKDLEILGADVAAQALRHGLVDEILVYLLPVVLGGGVPFSASDSVRVRLEPISSERAGAATVLRFRVRR